MRRRLFACLSLALLAGCSSQPPEPSAGAAHLAPPIAKPLKVVKYLTLAQVCATLDLNQLGELGMRDKDQFAVRRGTIGRNVGCAYFMPRTGLTFDVSYETGNPGGLDGLYARRSDEHGWQPITVQNYPAVITSGPDEQKNGVCSVHVGVNEQLEFLAQTVIPTSDPSAAHPCELAKRVADTVITILIKYP